MKIAILGTGAVGSLFAAYLSKTGAHEILCVVKSQAHADKINANGITITEQDGSLTKAESLRAVTGTGNEGPADLVLIAVKSHLTLKAVTEHRSLFGPDTIALTLQNGFGNHDDILTVCDRSRVLIGTTAQGVNIRPDGAVIHAGNGPTTLGPLDAPAMAAGAAGESGGIDGAGGAAGSDIEAGGIADQVAGILKDAGFAVEVTEDVMQAVLLKLLINIAINPLCALNDVSNSHITSDKELEASSKALVAEAVEILNIAGYSFDMEAVWERIARVVENTGANICSMLQDVRNGRDTEIDRINGAIVAMAEDLGRLAPANKAIVEQVKLIK